MYCYVLYSYVRGWNEMKNKKKSGRRRKKIYLLLLIRYQNVNSSMIKWPSGDMMQKMKYFCSYIFMIKWKERRSGWYEVKHLIRIQIKKHRMCLVRGNCWQHLWDDWVMIKKIWNVRINSAFSCLIQKFQIKTLIFNVK